MDGLCNCTQSQQLQLQQLDAGESIELTSKNGSKVNIDGNDVILSCNFSGDKKRYTDVSGSGGWLVLIENEPNSMLFLFF